MHDTLPAKSILSIVSIGYAVFSSNSSIKIMEFLKEDIKFENCIKNVCIYCFNLEKYIPLKSIYSKIHDDIYNKKEQVVDFIKIFSTEKIKPFPLKKLVTYEDYIKSYTRATLVLALLNLFKALDTPISERNEYDETVKDFPYVDGGLFKDEDIVIPAFTKEICDILLNDFASFNWSEISPTIFGALFENTLNPLTRDSGGMHYTSIANIHKLIDPLFFAELEQEFNSILSITAIEERNKRLLAFQKKIGALKFLDPACGSGNFLTETFLSLRRLENECIKLRLGKQKTALDVLGDDFDVQVKIENFYGIEINDFAVTVAKTAMWIAECQMMRETSRILGKELSFLPLQTSANIVENNALRLDWKTLKPIDENAIIDGLFAGFDTELDGSVIDYNYIIGNPPFIGYTQMSKDLNQKNDMATIFSGVKNAGVLDYVCAWYKKACDRIQGTNIKCAFVSTNSITQGEQVAIIWNLLFNAGIRIDFAYRMFKWENETNDKKHMAKVHCVIIGFSDNSSNATAKKRIFNANGTIEEAQNINGYLLNMPNVFIKSRNKPLCNVPEMQKGSIPVDKGNFFFDEAEYNDFISKEPQCKKFLRKFYGAKEFLHNIERYCLWLEGANPSEIKKSPTIMARLKKIKEMRLASEKEATRKFAEYPMRFMEIRQPDTEYILVPSHSSEKRKYIPIGFVKPDIICGNANLFIPNANLYEFGILTSIVHNAWTRVVCGRIEVDYRYSVNIVYNNFPWCNATEKQRAKIEKTAQAILDVRSKYASSSLSDLYDELTMPFDLRKAHKANDKAVLEAYGLSDKMSENEIVTQLFKLYAALSTKAAL